MIDGPIVGIRLWVVERESGHPQWRPSKPIPGLRSSNASYVWHPGVNKAQCNAYQPPYRHFLVARHDAPIPADHCTCGLHAFYELYDLQEFFSASDIDACIIGLVRGWGDVRLHPNGWRSRFAEPMALFRGGQNSHLVSELARIYEVPILSPILSSPVSYLFEEFGTIVPSHLRPTNDPYTDPIV